MRCMLGLLTAALLLIGCGSGEEPAAEAPTADSLPDAAAPTPNPTRNAYFGDLHVHTRFSLDAFVFGTTADPNAAYEFAKGGAILHPAGFEMKLDRPLDFQAVADHGWYLGMLAAMTDPSSPAYGHPIAEGVRNARSADERRGNFMAVGPYWNAEPGTEEHVNMEIVRDAWEEVQAAANRHNDPGTFTAFIGYEYTSAGEGGNNLHRNVIFRGAAAPALPFTRIDSSNPEDLWAAMDGWRAQGIDSLAIPHNSNASGGRMFELEYFDGGAIDDAYSELRSRNEPVVEITQVKGTSDTHPALSPNDEWAEFEIMPYRIGSVVLSLPREGSYVRDAYRRGLRIADGGVRNPYEFGLIGSSDSHVAGGSFEEDDYWSKTGILDATPQLRGSVPGTGVIATYGDPSEQSGSSTRTSDGSGRTYRDTYYHTWGASGLAGVWAEENTREAIFQALRRKETFATSGPRIRVRFFSRARTTRADLEDPGFLAKAYAEGVPMGGDLSISNGAAPTFAAWALRDPLAAPLDRLQIIKGWSENGNSEEIVYDIACSDGAAVDPATHRCPDNGASVDLATCAISADVGANELRAVWTDPDFDPAHRALYYVRVLENPTCRWSTWDALREGVEPRRDMPVTIQERAWSSPIWYSPSDLDADRQ
ncbi:MAG: DUF3604 domain-containing protein [Acidobacteriota bacterium]|nr:DUF3604 domain-containing protein [Acidobacteriota bacterium]